MTSRFFRVIAGSVALCALGFAGLRLGAAFAAVQQVHAHASGFAPAQAHAHAFAVAYVRSNIAVSSSDDAFTTVLDLFDLDGDGRPDSIVAAPFGGAMSRDREGAVRAGLNSGGAPGEVMIEFDARDADGAASIILRGDQPGDLFGHSFAVVEGAVDGAGALLIGAPGHDDNAGRAYLFAQRDLSPRVPGALPHGRGSVDVTDAHFTFASRFARHDMHFGMRVAPLFDQNEDGVPELRILSRLRHGGFLTHIFDGSTGELLSLIESDDAQSGPWAPLAGDVNGDGVVDRRDVMLLMAVFDRRDATGLAWADFNGDGVIDGRDLLIVLENLGSRLDLPELKDAGPVCGEGEISYYMPGQGWLCVVQTDHEHVCIPCKLPCKPECCDYHEFGCDPTVCPCNTHCPEFDCDPTCPQYDPKKCDPCNPPDPCNPACENFDPCNPACPTACEPECLCLCEPEEAPKFPGKPGEPNWEECCPEKEKREKKIVCLDEEKTLCAPPCPEECEQKCLPNLFPTWTASPASAVEWPNGNTGQCVTVKFIQPGEVTLSADNGCCVAEREIVVPMIYFIADTNRDGVIDIGPDGPDDDGKDSWTYGSDGHGAIIRVNNDDNDGNGVDAFDEIVNGPNDIADLTPIKIRRLEIDLPAGWRIRLRVDPSGGTAAAQSIRIFDGRHVLATARISPAGPHEYEIPAADIGGSGPPLDYGIEAVRYPGWPETTFDGLVTLVLELLDDTDAVQCNADRIQLRVAPWLMPSHLDDVTTVYVSNRFGARPAGHPAGAAPPFPDRLNTALAGAGVPLTTIDVGMWTGDPWVQDQIEVGFHSASGTWNNIVLNSPRDRSGDYGPVMHSYAADDLLSAGFGAIGIPANAPWSSPATTNDSFGNLEAFPPFGSWSSGHVYHGSGLQTDVAGFLAAQRVQGNPPFTPNTNWLLVKHVDEFMSVQRTGPDTFRVFLASPQMGIDILEELETHGFVFQHGQLWNQGVTRTAESLLEPFGGPNIKAYNQGLQTIINDRRAAMETLGITDFVEVPAYFVSIRYATAGSTGTLTASGPAQSMLPDMVNMLNVNGTLVVPDPNPHPGIVWPGGSDPFKQAFQNAVGAGTTVRWIDCMEYHYGVGEVHCGTNVRRTPRDVVRNWWLVEP